MQEALLLLLLAMILEKMVSAILMLPFLQISAQIISLNPDMNPHLLQGKNIHYITKVSVFLLRSESEENNTRRIKENYIFQHFSDIQMEIIRSTK